jgi:outer membrane protein OmpA-like peptidoglycan-associated protein/DNA repair exonuclease SbcCD ATPase subunit
MHDLSFFLLKSLLPVGALAILFFGIGLLLAKFIWGRFQHRLNNAVEENMNLASQWSALGASQQDLFKKLRVRWQSDRDAFEAVLGEKEQLIARLGEQLKATGADVSAIATVSVEDVAARARVRELESALAAEKAEVARLREASDRAEMPVLPFAVLAGNAAKAPEEEGLAARIRDLEQDLIDTHDEMHRVRADYEKQVKLVESLESKLIAVPAAPVATTSPELAQFTALLSQRAREAKSWRERSVVKGNDSRTALEAALADLEARQAALAAEALREKAEMEARFAQDKDELESGFAETRSLLEARLAEAGSAVESGQAEIKLLQESLSKRESELAEARQQLEEVELLRRRRGALQAELNDAHHELYDVRRALNLRIGEMGLLDVRLSALGEVDARNVALTRDLEATREQLAASLQSLASAEVLRDQASASLVALEALLESERSEASAVSTQLNDARRDLSEVRIALSAKSDEYQKALAQMEELEAIISDRSAEVNDLSAELRQQRDLVRQLKNTLAETEGELEALNEESRALNAGVKARAAFTEEQQARIAALELALSERYRELNRIRVEAEEHSRRARHHESRANQLESELTRRGAEFDASYSRVATAEEALEAANARIAALSGQLEKSEISLGELSRELQGVSREKDETLRDLERASRRVAELEEAARKREVQLVEIERELSEARAISGNLEQKIERLQVELESAREERRLSSVSVTELEESLRASDERTLQLASRLDEKEAEIAALSSELEKLQSLVDERTAGETEARARIAALEAEIETRLAELRLDHDAIDETRALEITLQAGEIAKLREQLVTQSESHVAEVERLRRQLTAESALQLGEIEKLRDQWVAENARVEEETALRQASLDEIEALREKLAARSESIRDLQNQISAVMMQRDSRDSELSVLKDKLRAMEEAPRESLPGLDVAAFAKPAVPQVDPAVLEAASQNLVSDTSSEIGISLDALTSTQAHHPPKPAGEPTPEPTSAWAGNDEDLTVFFNESASVPSQAEIEKIDRCARSIRRLGRRVEVTVIGYAGSEGSPDFNESVSARRADAVRERLLERGVSQAVVKVRAAGQDRRFSDWKARRVEMIVAPIAVAETVN